MKKALIALPLTAILIIAFYALTASPKLGAPTISALDGPHAIGVVVKNGAKMDQVLATNFTITTPPCDPEATTTPQELCTVILYQNQPVRVYYTTPEHLTKPQSPFQAKVADFPFSGHVDYVNRSAQDIDPKFIQFILESGNGSYELIYEP